MEFESPDVMKDFPGLYAPENSKKGSNDSDYSDETDKQAKKDILIKRKDKKDRKDKDKGYAALEGESSADENDSSPSKIKKTKTFKFASKSKEKREKSREKDAVEKKKDKEKKVDKKVDKEKVKAEKKEKQKENIDIAEGMPIFGVPLDAAVERSRCHDGVDIPLPVRACLDYIQSDGLSLEGVYKLSGAKSKVLPLRKLYNQRAPVDLTEFDIPVATSLLKLFLRDLPEPIFTSDLLIRFEEAGAILNVGTREKHLKILVENLPRNNRLLLAYLLLHFDDVVLNERLNKMNIVHVVGALAPTMHTSNRLLTALLHHCRALFPSVILEKYVPPLSSSAQLPQELDDLETELRKQESLLSQIHAEMNAGFIIKSREELLWEVQRIITQLKRRIKNLQKEEEKLSTEAARQPQSLGMDANVNSAPVAHTVAVIERNPSQDEEPKAQNSCGSSPPSSNMTEASTVVNIVNNGNNSMNNGLFDSPEMDSILMSPMASNAMEMNRKTIEYAQQPNTDEAITLLRIKNAALTELYEKLSSMIQEERNEIDHLKRRLISDELIVPNFTNDSNMDEVMDLLHKENQILEIKKINLVRQIMEQEEVCIDLKAKLQLIYN